MKNFIFTHNPPKCWHESCVSQGNLFHSAEWQNVLHKGFNCQTIYGWNAKTETGFAITIFKVGPFRIGYVGFPVGGILGKEPLDNETITALQKAHLPTTLHLLRLPTSAFDDGPILDLDSITTPETAIVDLQRWQLSQVPKFQRNVRKAQNSGIKIADASQSFYGTHLYRLYRKTILQHNGSLRYNTDYFSALIELSLTHPDLRCLLVFLGQEIVGFLVLALQNDTAYYLHGAIDTPLRTYGGSALLFYEAITWAKDRGMACFNLMASPNKQASLIRYKEKLGGITKEQKTYEFPIKPFYAKAFKRAMWFYNHVNKLFY